MPLNSPYVGILGVLGLEGHYGKAREYYEKAISLCHLSNKVNQKIRYNLGVLYYNGQGGSQDYQKARELFEELNLEGGNNPVQADAKYLLGVIYDKGQGVKKDSDKAKKLWEQAAAHGNENAKRALEESECVLF